MALDRINATALLDGGVTTADIADDAVTTAKLATQTGNVDFADNGKIRLGDSQDLQIYHDGSASRIDDAGTGDLILRSSSIQLQKYTGETMAGFVADGAVTLRYDNALKLATTSTGVEVTGGLGLTSTSVPDVSHNTTATGAGSLVGRTLYRWQGTDVAQIRVTAGTDTVNHDDASMSFFTSDGTFAERMVITSAGNVGIATTSPTQKLSISGDGGSFANTAAISLWDGNSAGSRRWAIANGASATGISQINALTFNVGSGSFTADPLSSGVEVMRINASGHVGIGTNSPDTALHVAGNSTVRNTIVSNFTLDGGVQVANPYDGFGFGIDFIGRDYGNAVRDYAYIYSAMEASGSNAGGGDAGFTAGLRFYTNGGGASGTIPTERMRITSSGNLQVSSNGIVATTGTNSGMNFSGVYGTFQTNHGGNDYPVLNIHTSGANNRYLDFRWSNSSVGNISTNGSSTSYNTSSDYRLKENVEYDFDATTRLKQLKPARFNFIADADNTVDGFLAHEVQSVVPEAITGTHDGMRDEEYEVTPAVEATYDDDGNILTEEAPAVMGTRSVPDYQGIDQGKIVPLLVKSLQEALDKIDTLETRLEALENA